jgi:hypothetical protein
MAEISSTLRNTNPYRKAAAQPDSHPSKAGVTEPQSARRPKLVGQDRGVPPSSDEATCVFAGGSAGVTIGVFSTRAA